MRRPAPSPREPLRGSHDRGVGAGGAVGEWPAGSPRGAMTSQPNPSFWQTIREAIRGSHQDYTSGPIGRAIILLAVPMGVEMLMESVCAVVGNFWVGHIGPDAVATVGLTEALLTRAYTAAMGLSIGVSAMVARRIGEKNPEGAAEAAVQGIALGVILAAAIGVAGGPPVPPNLAPLGGCSPGIEPVPTGTRLALRGPRCNPPH